MAGGETETQRATRGYPEERGREPTSPTLATSSIPGKSPLSSLTQGLHRETPLSPVCPSRDPRLHPQAGGGGLTFRGGLSRCQWEEAEDQQGSPETQSTGVLCGPHGLQMPPRLEAATQTPVLGRARGSLAAPSPGPGVQVCSPGLSSTPERGKALPAPAPDAAGWSQGWAPTCSG